MDYEYTHAQGIHRHMAQHFYGCVCVHVIGVNRVANLLQGTELLCKYDFDFKG